MFKFPDLYLVNKQVTFFQFDHGTSPISATIPSFIGNKCTGVEKAFTKK